jgi:hypothetical protein
MASAGITRAQNADWLLTGVKEMLQRLPQCPPRTFRDDCFYGGIDVQQQGSTLKTFLARELAAGSERTDVEFTIWPGTDAQNEFKSRVDALRANKTSQHWAFESFAAVPNYADSGALEVWLDTDFAGESREAARANGTFSCGAVLARLNMFIAAKADGPHGKALVDATQTQMKGLMQQLGKTFPDKENQKDGCNTSIAFPTKLEIHVPRKFETGLDELDFDAQTDIIVNVRGIFSDGRWASVDSVEVKLEYDNTLIGSGQTSGGQVHFYFNLPESTPRGRSTHTFKATASKSGLQTVEKQWQVEVVRDLDRSFILLDPIIGEYAPGETVIISGKVVGTVSRATLGEGSVRIPVRARIAVKKRYDYSQPAIETRTDADGRFSQAIQLDYAPYFISKAFQLESYPIQSAVYERASEPVYVHMKSKGLAQVTVATDKGVYKGDETITVSGVVTVNGKPAAGNVNLKFDNRQLVPGTTTADANGEFRFSFPIASLAGQIGPGTHFVSANAEVAGYLQGPESGAYFSVASSLDSCTPVEISIANIEGSPTVKADTQLGARANFPDAQAAPGTKLAQGLSVQTSRSDRVALQLQLDGQTIGGIVVGGDSKVTLARVCRGADGKIHATLIADKPGRIDIAMQSAGDAPSDVQIITPAATVSSIKTKYTIATEQDGTTTIVALEGVVRVADHSGAPSIELPAVNQITLRPGEKPDAANIKPYDGKPDPLLEPFASDNTPGASIAEPNVNASAMTLQAARRGVIVDDVVLVPVWLVKGSNVANLNVDIAYDPNVVRPEGALAKGNLLDNALFSANPTQSGRLRVGFAQRSGGVSGTGTVVNIPFRAVGDPGERTRIDLTITTSDDPTGANLPIERIAGEILIVNPDGTLPGSSAPGGPGPSGSAPGDSGAGSTSPGSAPGGPGASGSAPGASGSAPGASPGGPGPSGSAPGGGAQGGANAGTLGGLPRGACSGKRTLSEVDALCALDMSIKLKPAQPLMDMDGDGKVTSRDAEIILQQVIGRS